MNRAVVLAGDLGFAVFEDLTPDECVTLVLLAKELGRTAHIAQAATVDADWWAQRRCAA